VPALRRPATPAASAGAPRSPPKEVPARLALASTCNRARKSPHAEAAARKLDNVPLMTVSGAHRIGAELVAVGSGLRPRHDTGSQRLAGFRAVGHGSQSGRRGPEPCQNHVVNDGNLSTVQPAHVAPETAAAGGTAAGTHILASASRLNA